MTISDRSNSSDQSVGSFTVLDIMLFVAASTISIVLIRRLRPEGATLADYLELTAYCGPAGVALFGPWAVRRQFMERPRDELWPGEWLWIALGAAWLAAIPFTATAGSSGVLFVTRLFSMLLIIPTAVALIESLDTSSRRPWTHWAGLALCAFHSLPAIAQLGPIVWEAVDRVTMMVGT